MIHPIASGGSATVYLVEHIKLQSYRAIKRIRKDNMLYHQLINEAKILKNLKHPNIPVIYDIEEDQDYTYIIEEFIEGKSLKAYRLCQGIIQEEVIINFAIQICDLFQYLHVTEKPILYLDLKPDNIIVSQGTLKLIDFGTAIYSDEVKSRKTSLGTKGYAAPEQYGIHTVDQRSDIFGIGMLFFFLITGEALDLNFNNLKYLDQERVYTIQLKKVIYKCLGYYPSQRYQTIVKLKNKLLALQKKVSKAHSVLSNTSLIIAIAGAQSRVGTTHIAFLITSYLNYFFESAVYIEENDNLVIQSIQNRFINFPKDQEIYKIYYCPMYKGNPYTEKKYLTSYKYQVCDYGILTDYNLEEYQKADIKLMVLGTKAWELSHTHKCLKKLLEKKGIQYLFNFVDGKEFIDIIKSMENNKCIRVPFQPNPFQIDKQGISKDFVEECFEETSNEKKSNFIKGYSFFKRRKK